MGCANGATPDVVAGDIRRSVPVQNLISLMQSIAIHTPSALLALTLHREIPQFSQLSTDIGVAGKLLEVITYELFEGLVPGSGNPIGALDQGVI